MDGKARYDRASNFQVGAFLLWVVLKPWAAFAEVPKTHRCGPLQVDGVRLLKEYERRGLFQGAVLVARPSGRSGDENEFFESGAGYANIAAKTANGPETRFRIGSVTKQFTAVAILGLVAEKRIGIDQPIHLFLPGFPKRSAAGRVTVRQLLNQTSGFPDYSTPGVLPKRADSFSAPELEDAISAMIRRKRLQAPGRRFRYSNTNYFLLGRIVERLSGETYGAYVSKHLLSPLQMKGSGTGCLNNDKERARGYTKCSEGHVDPAPKAERNAFGSGAMYSTVRDLYRWSEAVLAGKGHIIPEALRRSMLTTSRKSSYGFGVDVSRRSIWGREESVIEHSGMVSGFASTLAYYPGARITVIVLSNLEDSPVDEIAENLAALALCQGTQPPRGAAPERKGGLPVKTTSAFTREQTTCDVSPHRGCIDKVYERSFLAISGLNLKGIDLC